MFVDEQQERVELFDEIIGVLLQRSHIVPLVLHNLLDKCLVQDVHQLGVRYLPALMELILKQLIRQLTQEFQEISIICSYQTQCRYF